MVDSADVANRFILVHDTSENFLFLDLLPCQVEDSSIGFVKLELLIANEARNLVRFFRMRIGSHVTLGANLMLAR